MLKRIAAISLCLVCLTPTSPAQKSPMTKKGVGPVPDKAFLQKIWDGWSTLDPANVAQYYATGPHTFFDIAPLKYESWDEYSKGAQGLTSRYESAKFTINDDAALHPHGDLFWVTATIAEQMTSTDGKIEMGNFRWTAILENIEGKWLIVHEHVSEPIQ
jgi:ketosteroid isomerase-like protein